jgi:hypothetical protein
MATPVQTGDVTQLLEAVGQDDASIRVPAEARLKELEQVSGYHMCMLQIALDFAQNLAVRLKAAIFFKSNFQRFLNRLVKSDAVNLFA